MQEEVYTMTYVGVHALFFNDKGQILIIQRCESNKYKPLLWDVPGGKKQSGESIENAIKREVFEETGLVVKEVHRPLSVFTNTTQIPIREDLQIVFFCTVENPQKEISLNVFEHRAYKWVNISELENYDLMDYLTYCYNKVLKNENKTGYF